jgi:peptidoglycan/LPS O-acetylase OafA/YrhL
VTSTLDRLGEGVVDSPTHREPARRFRPDIEGLRGIAVLLVVLYHAGLPLLPGGYVGVDVFFVISGYLITLHLTDAERGLPSLRAFYGRRIRRLLPSALVVILVSVIASRIWGPVLSVVDSGQDALAALGLVINYRFAWTGLDYLTQSSDPSPFLHFWSLSVEEQFYLVWPLLILVVLAVTRKMTRAARSALLIAVTVSVLAGSLACSVLLTRENASLAYYSLQTRAWELAAGAVLAMVAPALDRIPAGVARVVGWGGLLAVVTSAVVLDDGSPFPGFIAAIPVGGAALIIVAGSRPVRGGVGWLLSGRILRFLGTVSYTWYLWHWPVLVFAPAVFAVPFDLWDRLAMCVVSLWFAVLTSLLIERPMIRMRLPAFPWFRGGVGAAAVVAVVAASSVLFPPSIVAPAQAQPSASSATSGSGLVTPSLDTAAKDTPKYPASCIADFLVVTQPPCIIEPDGVDRGIATADRYVLLGDSHAGQWYPVVRSLANERHLDVQVLNKVGCPLASLTVYKEQLKRDYTECDDWRHDVLSRLASEPRPSIIFVSALNRYAPDDPRGVARGWDATMAALEKLGVPIVYLVDTPLPITDVPSCLTTHLADWSACDIARSRALVADPLAAAISAGRYRHAFSIDLGDELCPGSGDSCPVVDHGTLMYRDDSHMTDTYAASLTPRVRSALISDGLLSSP